MDRSKYPESWNQIALLIKIWAGWKCEQCGVEHAIFPRRRILTVHHIDGDPSNNKRNNLIALCAHCHLKADLEMHRQNARATRERKSGKLFFLEKLYSPGSATISDQPPLTNARRYKVKSQKL